MERDPSNAVPTAAERLEAARLEFDAQVRRFEEAKAALQGITDEVQRGRPRRELVHYSAFARLQARLDSMPVIEQAKGVLMAQQRCGPDEAFDLLRRASQRANVKVRFLAALIVEQISSQSAGPGAVPAKPAAVASYDSQPGIRRLNGQSPVPGDGG